jgi:hypothetical protein
MSLVGKGWQAIAFGFLAACLMLVGVWGLAEPAKVDPRNWHLADFVRHLHERGLHLKVVSSRQDGRWGGDLYLTENSDLTWQSFQVKPRTAARIEQWRGSVWVRRLPRGDTAWSLYDWQEPGCRIGPFLLFGDEELIERIRQTFA